ncbi:uncharacterized protein LOC115627657 [Scaptodrosophila lebanonensis]|uniref:Uncharacterized protein LOC115627657 n=1 Tax=Drosophila lebanonensis TaxID=7225 RepID=A0A6J2TVS8_DROLE|nr:uncharacterized protein LOC115627657 [Scaptodrosophila lebanonensis]
MFASTLRPVHNISLIYAIVWAINNNYGRYTTLPLNIAQFATSDESSGYQNDLIDAVLRLSGGASGTDTKIKFLLEGTRISADTNNMDQNSEHLGTNNLPSAQNAAIWFLDSLRAYGHLEHRVLQQNHRLPYNRNGYFCIVYTGPERGHLAALKQMFHRLFAIYVINVNVFLSKRGIVYLYTYYPYGPQRCQSSMPVFYASFQGVRDQSHFDLGKPFFPNKLDSMHGCKVVTVTFEHRPYVIIEATDSEPSGWRLRGMEGMLFNLLAEKMNFSIKLVAQPDKDRGIAYANGTITGATKMIVDGTANITFVCYMYSKARTEFMLPSLSYISFPIVLCIPGARPLTPFERLAKPFCFIIWSCLFTSVALGFLLIGALHLCTRRRLRRFVFGNRNRTPCYNLWTSLSAGVIIHLPLRNFARYILLLWLLYTFVLRTAFSGELYILLQDERMRAPLDSLSEVIKQSYTFHMLPTLVPIFRAMVPNIRIAIVRNGEHGMIQAQQRLRDDPNADIAMPMLQPTVMEYNHDAGATGRRLAVLQEPVLTAPLTLYMRPHSYLKTRIDDLLMAMMSAGIVRHFRDTYLKQVEQSGPATREPQKLTVWLLGGVFSIYLGMQLLACTVFGLEVMAASRPRVRRLMNLANRYIA